MCIIIISLLSHFKSSFVFAKIQVISFEFHRTKTILYGVHMRFELPFHRIFSKFPNQKQNKKSLLNHQKTKQKCVSDYLEQCRSFPRSNPIRIHTRTQIPKFPKSINMQECQLPITQRNESVEFERQRTWRKINAERIRQSHGRPQCQPPECDQQADRRPRNNCGDAKAQ